MIYSGRSARVAAIVDSDNKATKLQRIPLMEKSFNEKWLQTILEQNPEIIPSTEVGSEFAPLLCIGTEVPVGSGGTKGYIDNLYITPSGHLVVVETKLFRNQESKRAVVAQIIDYAKELQKWTCEQLDKIAENYTYQKTGKASRIIDMMAAAGYLRFCDEAAFTDCVNENLKQASFLLLIIGDGIRSGVQQLADFLNIHTNMRFHLGLVEMEIYQNGDSTIIIPNMLTKTAIIEKTMYESVVPSLNASVPQEQKKYIRKPLLSEKEFIHVFAEQGYLEEGAVQELINDIKAIQGYSIQITPTELRIRFAAGNATHILLYFSIADDRAAVWFIPAEVKKALRISHLFDSEAEQFMEEYKPFIDTGKSKYEPYETETGYYFADLNYLLKNESAFLMALERFKDNLNDFK